MPAGQGRTVRIAATRPAPMNGRRIIAAALPHLGAEAQLRREGQAGFPHPFAVVTRAGNALRLASVNPAAAALGFGPGLALADARALCPGLATRTEEPERLAAFRRGLTRWAGRFSPLGTMEGDALILDVSGCAHLFGGEAGMLGALTEGLATHGLTARAAMADTKGAAWALAWHGVSAPARAPASHPTSPPSHRSSPGVPSVAGRGGGVGGGTVEVEIAPRGHTRAALDALPVAALRLEPEVARGLAALGLATIGDAARIPRGALARRFGLATLKRLDQALGAEPEPVAPDRPPPGFAVRLTLPEPVGHVDDVMAGLERLLERLCRALEAEQRGARALRLTARRVDGADAQAQIALARPGRDPARLGALFARPVAEIDAGFGIDSLRLEATATEPLRPAQAGNNPGCQTESEQLADLLSRLGNRIGFDCLTRFLPAGSHIPERAFTLAAAAWSEPEPFPRSGPARPLTLFPPEPLETAGSPHAAEAATGASLPPRGGGMGRGGSGLSASRERRQALNPPPRFRWRGCWLTLAGAEGPERLAPEWWWDDPAWRTGTRDYWRAATAEGPRLWLFHTPQAHTRRTQRPVWWAQGEFA